MEKLMLFNLHPRISKIVRWILENSERIQAIGKGKLTINMAGDSVVIELGETIQV